MPLRLALPFTTELAQIWAECTVKLQRKNGAHAVELPVWAELVGRPFFEGSAFSWRMATKELWSRNGIRKVEFIKYNYQYIQRNCCRRWSRRRGHLWCELSVSNLWLWWRSRYARDAINWLRTRLGAWTLLSRCAEKIDPGSYFLLPEPLGWLGHTIFSEF